MIKAIETIYKGYKFRSRLEARWAVFFETLGIPWEYEKEGFDINGTYYLPDFYLPHLNLFIEIKPGDPIEWPDNPAWPEGDPQAPYLDIVVLKGNPYYTDHQYSGYDWPYQGYVYGDSLYLWCECPVCGKIGIQFSGRAARICRKCCGDSDKDYNTHTPRLIEAYEAARKARFEYGENK